jgi:hypothetical protein
MLSSRELELEFQRYIKSTARSLQYLQLRGSWKSKTQRTKKEQERERSEIERQRERERERERERDIYRQRDGEQSSVKERTREKS